MGRNQTKTCNVCFKAMRGDNLMKHMKIHDEKNTHDDNVVTKGLHHGNTVSEDNVVITNGPKISCAHEKFIALEKKVIGLNKEFNRKIELGRNLKTIVDKHQFNENIFEGDMKDALQTYKLHGKNMDIEDIEWRGWQRDLRQYLDKPCDRKVIWVVGKEGNEGKSFFQSNIREEFGYSRVCTLELSENSRNSFHIMGKICSTNTDIFLFNVARGEHLDREQYKILEYIKDGAAVDGKYNSQKLYFKKPNVLIAFRTKNQWKYPFHG